MDHRKIVFASLKLAGVCCDEFNCGQRISEVQDKERSKGYIEW